MFEFPYFLDDYYDWFVPKDLVSNRTGRWFIAVAGFKGYTLVTNLAKDLEPCSASKLKMDMLTVKFNEPNYQLRTYIGGMYYYNEATETWDGLGVNVSYYHIDIVKHSLLKDSLYP